MKTLSLSVTLLFVMLGGALHTHEATAQARKQVVTIGDLV